jgi:hypothetical protein
MVGSLCLESLVLIALALEAQLLLCHHPYFLLELLLVLVLVLPEIFV